MSQNRLIKLEVNGRIFPHWVIHNFKKYTLPKILLKEGQDPCDQKLGNELAPYQKFLGQYLRYDSPFRDMLIIHGMGSGKTASAVNIYNVLFNYTPKWNIFIIIPASLHTDPWLKDLKRWIKKDYELKMKNIYFVHYDSPIADRDFLDKLKLVDKSKKTMFIIDEAHKFIQNVYNNLLSGEGQRALTIYNTIQNEKKNNDDTRILLLTATPLVNEAFELVLYYNLLRPGIFPDNEETFAQQYIDSGVYDTITGDKKNMFQRRIMGLTSYYIGSTPDKFATKTQNFIKLEMSDYHQAIYDEFERIEREKDNKNKNKKQKGKSMSTYLSYTRQACNFVFPDYKDISGDKRPRPSNYRTKLEEGIELDPEQEKKMYKLKKKKEDELYKKALDHYLSVFEDYIDDLKKQDKKNGHTINDDIKQLEKSNNIDIFLNNNSKKSLLLTKLNELSPKFIYIILNMLKCNGSIMMYSNYVKVEGLQTFKIYLKQFGFVSYNKETSKNKEYDNYRYMEYHGDIDYKIRVENKDIFNTKENSRGKIIKLIMISSSGAEGINLANVRQVHITEPYWNEALIEQVIGRAFRQCKHVDLPMNERTVDVFRYVLIRKNKKETSDELLLRISRKKNNLLQSFLDAVKEVAVDCELFKNHNMMGTKYKCFKFNEEDVLNKPIKPAYRKDFNYDRKSNSGSNSSTSITDRVRTRKIIAVIRQDNNIFSQSKEYLYYKKTGIVYDINTHVPVGRILKDEKGNENKLDNTIYIIDDYINIPEFKLYD